MSAGDEKEKTEEEKQQQAAAEDRAARETLRKDTAMARALVAVLVARRERDEKGIRIDQLSEEDLEAIRLLAAAKHADDEDKLRALSIAVPMFQRQMHGAEYVQWAQELVAAVNLAIGEARDRRADGKRRSKRKRKRAEVEAEDSAAEAAGDDAEKEKKKERISASQVCLRKPFRAFKPERAIPSSKTGPTTLPAAGPHAVVSARLGACGPGLCERQNHSCGGLCTSWACGPGLCERQNHNCGGLCTPWACGPWLCERET